MRRGSRLAGLSPRSAMPLDDDLLRPWRSWWGLSIARWMWIRVVGGRNPFVSRCRRARWGGRFAFARMGGKRLLRIVRKMPRPPFTGRVR